MFVSAALLFWVQPMFGKTVLPLLGGSPAVWNTCMVFYQATLMAGYAYAHVSAKRLGLRPQAMLHLGLLALVLISLPVGLPEGWRPPAEGGPHGWLFLLLLVSVGPGFFVISATAPMLQKWFSRMSHPASKDPYFLYAASNLGSMGALLGYPLLIEPHLSLRQQAWAWAGGYGLMAVLISLSAGLLLKSSPKAESQGMATAGAVPDKDEDFPGLSMARRLRWVLLSFAPSSLLLGVTGYITTDIAPVPLLWVIPLSMYLLTFVLVFARRPVLDRDLMVKAQPFLILPLAAWFLWGRELNAWLSIPIHLLSFFALAVVCHGELAKDRPPLSHLTEFYLLVSLGGVLGGAFNTLLAPVMFNSMAEYPLGIVIASMLRPHTGSVGRGTRGYSLDIALPTVLAVFVVGLDLGALTGVLKMSAIGKGAVYFMVMASAYAFRSRPVRFGLGAGVVILAGLLLSGGKGYLLHSERSFFGVHRVASDTEGRYHMLYHGTTLHGVQGTSPGRRREPLAYFHRKGPLGQALSTLPWRDARGNVAVVGLGAGTIASYAGPGERWTFYEIDPAVERIARDTRFFTYLEDCRAEVNVILGDARLSLADAPDRHFGLIVLDAFSSDAIPVHLMTKEAMGLYLSKLSDGGTLLFNVTNRNFDFQPVLGGLAREAGVFAIVRRSEGAGARGGEEAMTFGSTWVVMARQATDLGGLSGDPEWKTLSARPGAGPWTDDYSNILDILR
jgi:hypothetical protein